MSKKRFMCSSIVACLRQTKAEFPHAISISYEIKFAEYSA